ncbi:MAG: hypothetical protein FWD73_02505 [Polyangiaceae bacterium]|nr:hypothetical protein [Polyangiaceae bacterium]
MTRSFVWPLAVATSALFASSQAAAQEITPPPPINANAPGGAPGTFGSPTGPGAPSPDTAATIEQLDEAERKDSGRKFEWFWVNGEIGGSYINMEQISSNSLGLEHTQSGGPMFGLDAGVRLLVFVLGARVRYNALSAFNMWQINGELGVKIPISKFDLGIMAHGGYSFVGRLGDVTIAMDSDTPTSTDAVKIRGYNAGLDLTLDYFLTPLFSIGVGAFGDFLFLKRPPIAIPAGLSPEEQAAISHESLYQQSGTSAGLQLGGAVRVGLHFGL